jgi:hypothetical protein
MKELSSKAKMVLRRIAEGRSYDQILQLHPVLTYRDIFDSATEVLTLADETTADTGGEAVEARRARRSERHPHAGLKWTDDEDARLRLLHSKGTSVVEMERELQRSELGIKARLVKLGLIAASQVPELGRLNAKRKRPRDGGPGQE